ncbi:TetR/AcrR family transcriptional regulator [Streptomyces sp. XD-27]|uniref:TetR/AcrR family transcriptional regulator n=1 Tax=Streptomyces sp. XD-27 TaxID=3062779 RepID=UPI0026F42838|nr:TetR/AcrR family transcriptional regulator [Streptomyces sp. XD-27]WKX70124.1 TetR/AcrR family transcriptional regulator [Streptomyces sp. XD-27]
MAVQQRRERERAERHRLIVEAARELAEAEGWGAVTTRRLSERVEYSQPVLYSHFASKDAIVAAVALEGFGELAAALRGARAAHVDAHAALRALADAYLDFARARPAVYAAMFVREIDVPFGTEASPAPLKAAFGEFLGALEPLAAARGDDPETLAEVVWSALHGLATLSAGHRLRPDQHDARVELLISRITASPAD